MFDVEITIRNYRCFGDDPVTLRVRDGFTALIGVNNSGKSSLLRLLYEFRPFFQQLCQEFPISHPVSRLLAGAKENIGQTYNVLVGERPFRAGVDRDIELTFQVNDGPSGPFVDAGSPLSYKFIFHRTHEVSGTLYNGSKVVGGSDRFIPGTHAFKLIQPFHAAMRCLADTMYVGPFRNAINIGATENYFDIQIGDAFVRQFAEFKSGPNPEANEAVASLIEEIRRIFGFGSLDVNPSPGLKALQVNVDGRSFRLTEQGAGLAHFIVVLVNVMVRRPRLLLIDEPELNLHASLQLDFLSTLAKYTKSGVIFATHSLGLARTSADRIYVASRDPYGHRSVLPYEASQDLVTLLGQLSFERRPDLGFSRILLVEGKTEVRALMQILRLYGKEHEVLCLPLHGGEMIRGDVGQELEDIKRIGGPVSFLVDSERNSADAPLNKRRAEFANLCAELGINGVVLARRALENYFSQSAIGATFGGMFEALGPFEKKGERQGWAKTENWRIAANMTVEDLQDTDLGKFLAAL